MGGFLMRRVMLAAFALVLFSLAGVARADEGPTGTWKWTTTTNNGQTRETTLKLKLDGDKLTGTVTVGNNDVPIEEATYKDGEVSFKVTRDRNGQKVVTKYTGKLDGDTIK